MKKLCIALLCVLLVGLCACGQGEPDEVLTTALFGAEATTEAVKATPLSPAEIKALESGPYADVLNSLVWRYHEELREEYYALCDIDGDGTDELLVQYNRVMNHGLYGYTAYTLQNGVAVQQEEFYCNSVSASPLVVFKNGVVKTDDRYLTYFRFDDGELKIHTRLFDEPDSEFGRYSSYSPLISSKRTPITKNEFDRLQKEMEGNGQTVYVNWKTLAEYQSECGPYNEVLDARIERHYTLVGGTYVTLYDLDGNGTRELLICEGDRNPYAIYILQDGIAVLQEEYFVYGGDGTNCLVSIFKNGTIRLDSPWEPFIYYFRFEDGKLKYKTMLIGGDCRIDGRGGSPIAITGDEYDQVIEEFEGDGQVIELDWKPLADYEQTTKNNFFPARKIIS